MIDILSEQIDRFTFYIFFLSSWAFLTIANFEWGSVTGKSEYGASFVPWSINVHSLRNPRLCRSAPLAKRTFKNMIKMNIFQIAYICFMVPNKKTYIRLIISLPQETICHEDIQPMGVLSWKAILWSHRGSLRH